MLKENRDKRYLWRNSICLQISSRYLRDEIILKEINSTLLIEAEIIQKIINVFEPLLRLDFRVCSFQDVSNYWSMDFLLKMDFQIIGQWIFYWRLMILMNKSFFCRSINIGLLEIAMLRFRCSYISMINKLAMLCSNNVVLQNNMNVY